MTTTTEQPLTASAATEAAFDWLALGAALVTVVLWASAFVGIRAVADHLDPGPDRCGEPLPIRCAGVDEGDLGGLGCALGGHGH